MSYGLFDADIPMYPYVPFFNLELMKLSSFYKRKREIVTLSPSFSPNRYQHFILRQDFPGTNYPIIKYNNIEYGGRAFNWSKYQPLPIEIEKMVPDTFIYNKIEEPYLTSKARISAFRRMRNAEHIRLSLDGKTIWKDFESQFKNERKNVGIIFHDYDLNKIDGAYETVVDILKDYKLHRDGQRIGMKFPVQVTNGDELLRWASIKPMQHFYYIQYNGIMTMPLIKEYIEVTRHTSSAIQSFYNISKNVDYNHFITQDIVEVYKQVCFLRTNQVYFSLIYDEDFFLDRRWEEVIQLINNFWVASQKMSIKNRNRVAGYDSMYNFIKYTIKNYTTSTKSFTTERLREIFQFVRQENYELFKLFYEYKA